MHNDQNDSSKSSKTRPGIKLGIVVEGTHSKDIIDHLELKSTWDMRPSYSKGNIRAIGGFGLFRGLISYVL